MNDKEIEEKLKESANKIELDDFSECWDKIKDRMDKETVDFAATVSVQSKVLVTNSGVKVSRNKRISLFIILAGFVCIGIVLSIVLPIVLKKSDIKFFDEDNLAWYQATEEKFYNEINELNINMSVFPFEMDSFELAVTEDEQIKGGKCNIFDEATLCEGKFFIYDKSVSISKFNYEEYSDCFNNVSNKIYYTVENTADNLYKITSAILTATTNYKLDLTFYDGNKFLLFVDKYFN